MPAPAWLHELTQARKVVTALALSSNSLDQISVVVVGDKPSIAFSFDDPIDALESRLSRISPDGETALWDSMFLSVEQLKKARYRRHAIVVVSDGGDNHSRYSESDLKSLLEEAGVQVYAVGMFDRFPRRNEERRGPRDLDELTRCSGGRLLSVHDEAELHGAVAQLNEELHNQYVLGYVSTNRSHDGRWRRLKVTVPPTSARERLQAFAKEGYYASTP